MTRPDIAIYGATGFTGRLVAERLRELGERVVLVGRDSARLQSLSDELDAGMAVREGHVHDGESLRAALAGTRVVINCAGPFTTLGEPVVRAAIDCGAHYLDSTGEQRFMRSVYERSEAAARRAGVCVVNAFAFEVALGDFAAATAAAALPGAPLDELSVSYTVDSFRTTPGTQRSILSSLAEEGCLWAHDRWEPVHPAAETRMVRFPEPFGLREALSFPSGEVITVPRHVHTHRVQCYAALGSDSTLSRALTVGATLVGPFVGALMQSPLGAFARAKIGELGEHGARPNPASRRQARFAILARAERSFERKEVSVSGTDPYGVTAEILAFGALQLLEGRSPAGVLAPSQAFPAADTLAELARLCQLEVVRS